MENEEVKPEVSEETEIEETAKEEVEGEE